MLNEILITFVGNLPKEALFAYKLAWTEKIIARNLRNECVSTRILDDFEKIFGERPAKNIARAGRTGIHEELTFWRLRKVLDLKALIWSLMEAWVP